MLAPFTEKSDDKVSMVYVPILVLVSVSVFVWMGHDTRIRW